MKPRSCAHPATEGNASFASYVNKKVINSMKITVTNPKTLGEEHLNDKFDYDEIDDMGRRIIKAGDKEFLIRADHRSGLWSVFKADGGPVPLELQGYFTNIRHAEHALAQFASRVSTKGAVAKKHKEALGESFDTRGSDAHTHDLPVKKKK